MACSNLGADVRACTLTVRSSDAADLDVILYRSAAVDGVEVPAFSIGDITRERRDAAHDGLAAVHADLDGKDDALSKWSYAMLELRRTETISGVATAATAASAAVRQTSAISAPRNSPVSPPVLSPPTAPPTLRFLEQYLRDRLFAAFTAAPCTELIPTDAGDRKVDCGGAQPGPINHFDVYVTAATVKCGGFGAAWHQDSLAVAGHDFDYVALYYVDPSVEPMCRGDSLSGCGDDNSVTGSCNSHWLEVALDTQLLSEKPDRQQLCRDFAPFSTADRRLMVLRNANAFHRTPLLVRLAQRAGAPTAVRRFLWMPFSAFDAQGRKVALACPETAACSTGRPRELDAVIAEIETAMQAGGVAAGLDGLEYVDPDGACVVDAPGGSMDWLYG